MLATFPLRRMTVTRSSPARYQQVSTSAEDSTLVTLIHGLPAFLIRSALSMPAIISVKSAGSAGAAGVGAAATPFAGALATGADADDGAFASSAFAAPARV